MNLAEDMWLRGQAAQRSLLELTAYNAAFFGNATVQAVELGLSAPMTFWSAMGRAGGLDSAMTAEASVAANHAEEAPAEAVAPPQPAPMPVSAEIVQLHADPVSGPDTDAAPTAVPAEVVAEIVDEVVDMPSPHLLDGPRGGAPDDLTSLKGVGAKLAEALNDFGIYHFDQIAALDEAGIDWLNDQQPGFKMTCARYDIVAQAAARSA